jgi:hypothetical protein
MKWAAPLPKLFRIKHQIVSLIAFAVPSSPKDFNPVILQGISAATDIYPKNMPVYCAVSCRTNAYAEEFFSVYLRLLC